MYQLVNSFESGLNFPFSSLYIIASTEEENDTKYLPALTNWLLFDGSL